MKRRRSPRKSSKNQVPTKTTTIAIDEEQMEEETTKSTSDKNPREPTRTEQDTRPTIRRTPPPPTPGKATPMKRPQDSSSSPDYSAALKRRLTDEDGFTLVMKKRTPDKRKPENTAHAERPKPQRPKPLVVEGPKLEGCSSPTEVAKILNIRNAYKILKMKAGIFLLYAPDEKSREKIKKTTDDITTRDTRAATSANHFPVIIKNIPINWNTSALEEKHTIRRMRSAKTGKDINKIKILCPDANTQEEYLDRGIIVNKE